MARQGLAGVDGNGAALLHAASRLASAYLSGYTDPETAAALQMLLPGAAFLSVSMSVGGKLLVTESDLLRPGFVSVAFDDADTVAAGRAMTANACFQADAADARAFPDFARAAANGACNCLIAAPITPRQRRVSAELKRPAVPSATRRNSESDSAAFALHKLKLAPLGGLTLGTQAGSPLLSIHRFNLTALAECLAPLLGRYGYPGGGQGLESLFCQSEECDAHDAMYDSDESERASWDEASSVEEYVDSLICRQRCGDICAPAAAADNTAAVPRLMPGPAEQPVLA